MAVYQLNKILYQNRFTAQSMNEMVDVLLGDYEKEDIEDVENTLWLEQYFIWKDVQLYHMVKTVFYLENFRQEIIHFNSCLNIFYSRQIEKKNNKGVCMLSIKNMMATLIYLLFGKFGKSCILTLKTREGDSTRVWACSGLNKEKDFLEGAYVRNTGSKISKKSKQEYFSYDLVRM